MECLDLDISRALNKALGDDCCDGQSEVKARLPGEGTQGWGDSGPHLGSWFAFWGSGEQDGWCPGFEGSNYQSRALGMEDSDRLRELAGSGPVLEVAGMWGSGSILFPVGSHCLALYKSLKTSSLALLLSDLVREGLLTKFKPEEVKTLQRTLFWRLAL